MKVMRTVLAILITIAMLGAFAACGSKAGSAAPASNQVYKVQRGDLSVEITASGNLAFSRWEDLAFQVSSTQTEPITVAEVKVEAGDSVKQGQVLVTIDTKALNDKVTTRERSFNQAQISFKNAEMSVTSAQTDLQTARDSETNIKSAEMSLESASDSYRKVTYPYTFKTVAFDVPAAITSVHEAEMALEKVKKGLSLGPGSPDYNDAAHQVILASESLEQARIRLSLGQGPEVFANYYTTNVTAANASAGQEGTAPALAVKDYWTLRDLQRSVESAQMSLDKAKQTFKTGLDKAQMSLDKTKLSLDQSKLSLEVAQEDLNTAKADLGKATLVAPFDGFVSQVNVKGGDEVKQGTVAVQVADPNKFEAEIMVNEMDISQVKVDGKATVQANAMPSLTIPAKVTAVSPTATIQSGVVNYKVKVELESLQTAMQQRQPGATPRPQSTRPQGQTTQTPSQQQARQRQAQQLPVPAATDNVQLRQGLTVAVSISVDQRNNVLMVPNTAITRQGTKSLVKVSKAGVVEEREIKTGISNWEYTEVTEGVAEGDEIVVPQVARSSTSSSQPKPPTGGIPGIGRIIR